MNPLNRACALLLVGICSIGLNNEASASQTLSFQCSFKVATRGEFTSSGPQAIAGNAIGEILFDEIDSVAGTGRMIGNAGGENIQAIVSKNNLHLFEFTQSGNFTATTIFLNKAIKPDVYWAAHSRHINLTGGAIPSQSIGVCRRLF